METIRKKREKIPNMESLTIGNCTVSLTLDTRYRDENGKYHASIRFTVNGSRYFFHLGNKYTVEEFDAINKADGRGRGGNQSQNFIDRNRLVEFYNQYVDLVRDMYNKGTLKSVDNIRAVITGRISTYGSSDEATTPYANSFIGLWNEVISQKKASTAETYRNARDCFIKSGVYDAKDGYNVDVDKVKAWIAYMKEMRYTQTTIGFYLRAIRVVFKACISNGYMREKDYPFSATDPMKVKIPSGSSRKADKEVLAEKADPVINFADPEEDEDETVTSPKESVIAETTEHKPADISRMNSDDASAENYSFEELLSLGERYEKGVDVEENLEKAFYYYEKAALSGDPAALNKLGNMYAQGKGCTKNASKAASYYLAAAEKGNKYAQHNIAFCYWDGVGIEKDREAAVMWMRRSAAQGYEKAKKALKTMGVE